MKTILKLALFLLIFLPPAWSQQTSTAAHIRYGATLPATCKPSTGDVFFKTSATIGSYQCLTTNTWTAMGGGGAGGSCDALGGDVTGTCAASTVVNINGVSLAGLATGILKNTTATGVPSIAVGNVDYLPVASPTATGTLTVGTKVSLDGTTNGIATSSYLGGVLLSGLTGPVKFTAGVPSIALAADMSGLYSGSCPSGATCALASDGTKQVVSAFPYAYQRGSFLGMGLNLDNGAQRAFQPFNNSFNALTNCAAGTSSYWQMPIGGFIRNVTGTTGITNGPTPIRWLASPGCAGAVFNGIGPVTVGGAAAGGVIDNNPASWLRIPQWNPLTLGLIRMGANNTANVVSVATEFISDDGLVDTVLGLGYSATLTASSTQYQGFGGANITTTEANVSLPVPIAGTFKNLFSTNTATPTAAVTIALRKNAADSALTVTIGAGDATGSYTDTTHTVSAVAGDSFSIQTISGATTQAIIQSQGVVFVPTDGASTFIWGNWAGATVTTANKYALAFSSLNGTTIASFETTMPFACTMSNLYIYQAAANGGSTVTTFTLMKNGSTTAITGTANVGVSGSIALDTTHSVAFAQGDLVTLQAITNTGTSGAMGGWSAKCL